MISKTILVGNVGADPEVTTLQDGSVVAKFSLATSKKRNNETFTEWHQIVIWNKLADIVKQYVHKGQLLYLEGENRTRSWEDKDGNKRYTTEVVCFNMQMLSRKQDSIEYGDEPDLEI